MSVKIPLQYTLVDNGECDKENARMSGWWSRASWTQSYGDLWRPGTLYDIEIDTGTTITRTRSQLHRQDPSELCTSGTKLANQLAVDLGHHRLGGVCGAPEGIE